MAQVIQVPHHQQVNSRPLRDSCCICYNFLDEKCVDCQTDQLKSPCPSHYIDQCHHGYHADCILRWWKAKQTLKQPISCYACCAPKK